MPYIAPESYPARPEEFEELNKQAAQGFEMTVTERMDLLEKLRQAYYGYSAGNRPSIEPVVTFVDLSTGQPVFTSSPSGCTHH